MVAAGVAALEVPFLAGRVNDLADLLSAEEEGRVEQKLAALEAATGAQVAVLTIESLEGEPLEEFALRVAETWELGRAAQDDGVLLLVAQQDRKMRLEVGHGLEGSLTDALSGRILDNIVRPRFKAGEFGPGIEAGLDAVAAVIQGDTSAVPEEPPATAVSDAPWYFRLFFFGIYALVVGIFSALALFSKGGQSWLLYFFLMPFHLAFPAILHPLAGGFFFLAWVVGFPVFKRWLGHSAGGKGFLARHPGWTTFATSSGRSSGGWSSSGGGGFSGGGGSFGGGGASSSW